MEKRAVLGVVDMFVVPLPFYLVVDTYKLVLLLAASKESGIELLLRMATRPFAFPALHGRVLLFLA